MSSFTRSGAIALAVAVATTSILAPSALLADVTGFGQFDAVNYNQEGVDPPDPLVGYSGDGSTFQVTTLRIGQQVSGYFAVPQNITSFSASFDYRSVPGNNQGTATLQANGIGLNFITAPTGTATLGGVNNADLLGIGGVAQSASLLVNNFGGVLNYPGGVHLQTGGNVPVPNSPLWRRLPTPGLAVLTGNTIRTNVTYNQGTVRVDVTDLANNRSLITRYANVDLAAVLGSTSALVGFSGSAGGFVSDQQVSNFAFTAGTGTTTGLFTRTPSAASRYTPMTITGGLNTAIVVPAIANGASGEGVNFINATPDNGTFISASAGTGFTWYEVGTGGSPAGSGLPASGTTFFSQSDARHTFRAPTYGGSAGAVNDTLTLYGSTKDINGTGNRAGTLTFDAPTAQQGLSILSASGNGPGDVNVVVTYADGSTAEVGNFLSPDWVNAGTTLNGSSVAVSTTARLNALSGAYQNLPMRLWQSDLALPLSAKAITSVTFSLDGASTTGTVSSIFAVSGVNGSIYALPGSGDAASPGSWVNGVPNAVDAPANFGDSILASSTVTFAGPTTVGALNFERVGADYTLAGPGPITLDVATGAADIRVVAGNHTVNAPLVLADSTTLRSFNNGSVTLGGPVTLSPGSTLTTSGTVALNGRVTGGPNSTLTVGGGTTTFGTSQRVPSITVAAGARAVVANVPTLSLIRTESLAVGAGATLDLGDNALLVDYAGPTPLAFLRSQIASGAIFSADVAAATNLAIGYAEATEIPNPFAGEALDATAVILRVTLRGDTDLNATVAFADLVKLAQNYNSTGADVVWSDGDFDGNGTVGFSDLVALAQNYNASLAGDAQLLSGEGGSAFMADLALAQSLVPEPTVLLSGLGLAALGLTRRRTQA